MQNAVNTYIPEKAHRTTAKRVPVYIILKRVRLQDNIYRACDRADALPHRQMTKYAYFRGEKSTYCIPVKHLVSVAQKNLIFF